MNQKELSIVLRELACSQPTPLCQQWTEEWADDTDIDTLLDKYIRGFDFSLKNNYPPLDFCRKNFNKEDLHRHNIYLDEKVAIEDAQNGYYVFIGNCEATIIAKGFKAITVYCRHESKVNVYAFEGARVFVRYYDASNGDCEADQWSKAIRFDRQKK